MTQNKKDKALPTGGTLERIFGGVTAKILDFLSTHCECDYSKQDIAKYSNVSIRHALRAIEQLEQLELIKHTRKVGHSHMYKYNIENKAATLLDKFMLELAGQECQKIADHILALEQKINSIKPPISEENKKHAYLCLNEKCMKYFSKHKEVNYDPKHGTIDLICPFCDSEWWTENKEKHKNKNRNN